RSKSSDRRNLKFTDNIDEADLLTHDEFNRCTKKKISQTLRAMAVNHHEEIDLGALGCGAVQTPPKVMAVLFQEVLSEDEFKGRFKRVNFAILNIFPKDQDNINAFKEICDELNTLSLL